MDGEEELWGCVFNDGPGDYSVSLLWFNGTSWEPPYGAGDATYRVMSLSDNHGNDGAQWGWFGFPLDCHTDSTTNLLEVHVGSSGREKHCLGATTLLWRLSKGQTSVAEIPVDFIRYEPTATFATYVDASIGGEIMDLIINYDTASNYDPPVAVPSVSVGPTRTSAWVETDTASDGMIHVPNNMVLRIGAWNSIDHWQPGSGSDTVRQAARLLARYFWNDTLDLNDATGYGVVWVEQGTTLRASRARMWLPLTSGGPRTVVLRVRAPTGRTHDARVGIYVADELVAHPVMPSIVMTGVSAEFTARDTNDIAYYHWYIDETPAQQGPDAAFDTTFTSAGPREVRLVVVNRSGLTAESTSTLQVLSPIDSVRIVADDGGTVNGPIRTNTTCSWVTEVYGGTGPFTYSWERLKAAWVPIGSAVRLSNYSVGTSSFTMRVRVAQPVGMEVADTVTVQVSSSGRICTP